MKKTGVVIFIQREDKTILLVKQNKEPYKGYWAPPHGTIEAGETVQQAVIREAMEEIGLSVLPVKELWVSDADYKVSTLYWWLAKPSFAEDISIDTREISEYGYFSLKNLFALRIMPSAKTFLFRLQAGEILL